MPARVVIELVDVFALVRDGYTRPGPAEVLGRDYDAEGRLSAPGLIELGSRGTPSRTRLLAGRVRYPTEPIAAPAAGQVLLCCAQPDGEVVLDL